MSRKTCKVEELRKHVNSMLAESVCSAEQREGMSQVLQHVLMETGNYNGFGYLTKRDVPKEQLPGMNSVDESLDADALYKARFKDTDDTRRKYF